MKTIEQSPGKFIMTCDNGHAINRTSREFGMDCEHGCERAASSGIEPVKAFPGSSLCPTCGSAWDAYNDRCPNPECA